MLSIVCVLFNCDVTCLLPACTVLFECTSSIKACKPFRKSSQKCVTTARRRYHYKRIANPHWHEGHQTRVCATTPHCSFKDCHILEVQGILMQSELISMLDECNYQAGCVRKGYVQPRFSCSHDAFGCVVGFTKFYTNPAPKKSILFTEFWNFQNSYVIEQLTPQ